MIIQKKFTVVALAFAAAVLMAGNVKSEDDCGSARVTRPDCATGQSHPDCQKVAQTGLPPFCGTSYRTGRTNFSFTTVIPQSDCESTPDKDSECNVEDADCEQYTEGTCSNYVKLECWGKAEIGTGQFLPVNAGAEGGVKFEVFDVDKVTTLGPVLRGAGKHATTPEPS